LLCGWCETGSDNAGHFPPPHKQFHHKARDADDKDRQRRAHRGDKAKKMHPVICHDGEDGYGNRNNHEHPDDPASLAGRSSFRGIT
jgi:hypothetical protein